ncbi:MAG: hypothetical protein AAFY38_13420 [Pseudomonadota bacterium]
MSEAAQKIYQQVLDDLTEGVVSCNYDMIRPRLAIPHLMVTSTARLVAKTEAEMQEAFMTFAMGLRQLGITDYTRIAHECDFLGEDEIIGHHTSFFRKEGRDVVTPYPSMCRMERRAGAWVLTEAQNAIDNSHWPILLPDVPSDPVAGAEGPAVRLRALQEVMDRISSAFIENDLQRWLDCVELPFTLISRTGPERFETEADIRADFEAYQRDILENGITDIFRTALSTQAVGPDQMIGIYRTRILRGTEQAVPAWQAAVTLRKRQGTWRATSVLRAIGHQNWSAATAGDIQTISNTPHNLGERPQ